MSTHTSHSQKAADDLLWAKYWVRESDHSGREHYYDHMADCARTAYHVAPIDHVGDLHSLYEQHGDKAYEIFAQRWPEAGDMGGAHAHYVHLYANLTEARDHAEACVGKIYCIDLDALTEGGFNTEIDELEFAHVMVRDTISAEYMEIL